MFGKDKDKQKKKKEKMNGKAGHSEETTMFFMTISLFPKYTQKSKNKAIPRKQTKSR